LRKELIGDEKSVSAIYSLKDEESVALWNPRWRVICPDLEEAPKKLTEYAGRKNVLVTHPIDRQTGAALEGTIEVPAGRKATLTMNVAAHEQGDWELRVLADGKLVQKQVVDKKGQRWKQVQVDLSPYAGRKTVVRLENCANDWNWEFGYWNDIELKVGEL
jgi:hypothetical protein